MAIGRIVIPRGRLAGIAGDTSACCWRQSRHCSDNSLSGLWLMQSLIPASNTIIENGICYWFNPSDPLSACPGTGHALPVVSIPSCNDAACGAPSSGIDCIQCGAAGSTPRFVDVTCALNMCPAGCRVEPVNGLTSDDVAGSFNRTYRMTQVDGCNYEYSGISGVTRRLWNTPVCTTIVNTFTNVIIDAQIQAGPQWLISMAFEDGEGLFNEVSAVVANCMAAVTTNKTDLPVCGFGQILAAGGSLTLTPTNV